MKKEYHQSYRCEGFSTRVTIEWEAPEDFEGNAPDWCLTKAEEQADEIIAYAGPKTYGMVRAMRGFTK